MQTREGEDDATIVWQGWGVFYAQDATSKYFMGQKFFVNQEFAEQKKVTEDVVGDGDKFGPMNVPSKTSFWMIISKQGLYFLSSRKEAIQKFKHFTPFNALKDGAEALKELGAFDEGYCLQINSVIETIIVCLPTKAAFSSFFMSMQNWASKSSANMKDTLNYEAAMTQHETEQIVDYPHLNPNGWEASSKMGQENVNRKDSYWMLMQNWGECSVACGGGTTTRQLVCVKGTEGLPCVGKSVQHKPCSLQPCTPTTPRDDKVVIKPMIIKSSGASKRPCQYQPCYLKECDLILVRDDMTGFQVPPRLPARVVMNNATLSIFMSDNFGDVMWSVDLPDIKVVDYAQDRENCFTMKNDRLMTSRTVCGMPMSHFSLVDQCTDWREKINMFKTQCPKQFQTQLLNPPEEDPTVMAMNNAVAATAAALKNQAKITGNEEASKKVNTEFAGVKDGIISTLNKEMKFENLVEQEEMMKMKQKKKEVEVKTEQLKEQEECLENKQQLETEEQKQEVMEESAKETIDSVKDAVKDMIVQSRNTQNQKINLMRKIKNKSTSSQEAEMTVIRDKIAKELKKAFEKGDDSKCIPDAPQADIMEVCNKYYINEPVFYDKCQQPEAFCTYCCVGCFGQMFPKDKNKCLDVCLKAEVSATTSQVWDKLTKDQAGLF